MKFNFFSDSSDECREERREAMAQRKARRFCPSCHQTMRDHAMNCPNYEENEGKEEDE